MILILSQSFPPDVGGIQNLMGGLAAALCKANYRVEVMVDSMWSVPQAKTPAEKVVVRRFGGPKLLRRRIKARAAEHVLATEPVEAVFCDSWKSIELVVPTRAPIAVLAHGAEFPKAASWRKKHRVRKALAKASVVIANSRYTADLARPYLGPDAQLVVIHPPISPQPAPTAEAFQRLRDQVADRHPLLVGLGRLEPRKGFDRVIQALPRLAERFPGVALAVGGTGDDAGRLKQLAQRAGVGDRVYLLGQVSGDEKAALLSSADLFVMPARREGNSVEGFGIVYMEAAWYGVPSIAGLDGGGSDAVVDGETGHVVQGDDLAAVEQSIGALLADDDQRKAMGTAARDRVLYSGVWESALPRYLEAVLQPQCNEQPGCSSAVVQGLDGG